MFGDFQYHQGDFSQRNNGTITFDSSGMGINLVASSLEQGTISLNATSAVQLASGQGVISIANEDEVGAEVAISGGLTGMVAAVVGPPMEGSQIRMEPEEITITCGPIGVGASIIMTPESITFKVAEVMYTMTPEGITEEVVPCTRELTSEGHNFQAAETECNIGVAGIEEEAPVEASEVEGGSVENATLTSETTDALENNDAGIMMQI